MAASQTARRGKHRAPKQTAQPTPVSATDEQPFTPSPYQQAIFDFVRDGAGDGIVNAVAGAGKCLGKDTPVLLYDGRVIPVQDVQPGDLLMGPDSRPRLVLRISQGHGPLYRIIPVKGESWVCNDAHILTLTGTSRHIGEVRDVALRDYLRDTHPTPDGRMDKEWKLWRAGVEFPERPTDLDPYLVGLWLGDGTFDAPVITNASPVIEDYCMAVAGHYGCELVSTEVPAHNTRSLRFRVGPRGETGRHTPHAIWRGLAALRVNREKRIPLAYRANTRAVRLSVLAGLLDTDGYLAHGYYEISTKHTGLKDDLLFLARSLGFAAYATETAGRIAATGFTGDYWRISIAGDITSIPCRLHTAAPRTQIKRTNVTGWDAEEIGTGDYYGFTLSGDGRFLLGDFTVTHNTTTLVEAAKLRPDVSGIFLAFNKHIAEELAGRLHGTSFAARTIHSVGFGALCKHLAGKPQMDGRKYEKIVRGFLAQPANEEEFLSAVADPEGKIAANRATGVQPDGLAEAYARYHEARAVKANHLKLAEDIFADLLHMGRLTRTNLGDAEALAAMIGHYTVECPTYLQALAPRFLPRLLAKGEAEAEEAGRIDFTDMLYLPLIWHLPLPTYGLVLCDECQDFNAAQLEIALRLRAPDGGRMIFVGDPRQSIFGFAGADSQSFYRIKGRTLARELPLSVCYRCPTAVLDLAREIVPHIEAAPGAPTGIVRDITLDALAEEAQPGRLPGANGPDDEGEEPDMVLCRLTAPLIAECIHFIQRRIPARVRGRDLGKQLCDVVKAVALMPTYRGFSDFGTALEDYRATQTRKLASKEGTEGQIESLNDRCDAVRVCAETYGAKSVEGLCAEIASLFDDEVRGVIFSTVHRAKGLECPRVYLLKPHKLPLTWPKQQAWEAEQEANLKYVAITRARFCLTFVHDDAAKMAEAQQERRSLA